MATSVEAIYQKLEEAKSDMEKAHKGNKAAATRSRNVLSEVAKLCKESRQEILAASKGEREDDLNLA